MLSLVFCYFIRIIHNINTIRLKILSHHRQKVLFITENVNVYFILPFYLCKPPILLCFFYVEVVHDHPSTLQCPWDFDLRVKFIRVRNVFLDDFKFAQMIIYDLILFLSQLSIIIILPSILFMKLCIFNAHPQIRVNCFSNYTKKKIAQKIFSK